MVSLNASSPVSVYAGWPSSMPWTTGGHDVACCTFEKQVIILRVFVREPSFFSFLGQVPA